MKKKREKQVNRLNHDARNHMGGSRGGGGGRGSGPRKITSYMGFYKEQAIGPPPPHPEKVGPQENGPPPLEPWKMIVFFESTCM